MKKQKRFSHFRSHQAAPSCLLAALCVVVLISAAWAVSDALRIYELNQRTMLCKSAGISGNLEYLEKCANPDYLELKN